MAAAYAAPRFDIDPVLAALTVILVWFAAEAELARAAGWRLTWRSPFAWAMRDLLLPVLFAGGWVAGHFVWRGNAMDVRESKQPQ